MIDIKQGDTFSVTLTVTRSSVAVDLTGVAITSQVRAPGGEQIATLTVTPISLTGGMVQLRSETTTWPARALDWDVQFVENGNTWSTPTTKVNVQTDVTQ